MLRRKQDFGLDTPSYILILSISILQTTPPSQLESRNYMITIFSPNYSILSDKKSIFFSCNNSSKG